MRVTIFRHLLGLGFFVPKLGAQYFYRTDQDKAKEWVRRQAAKHQSLLAKAAPSDLYSFV